MAIGRYRERQTSFQMACPPDVCGGGGDGDGGSDGGGGTGGGTGTGDPWAAAAPGIWLTDMWVGDLKEPWTKGEPEIEVHTAVRDPLVPGGGTMIRCVAESKIGNQKFVMNENNWTGAVLVGAEDILDALAPSQGLLFLVMEDDDTTCEPKLSDDEFNDLFNLTRSANSGNDALKKDPSLGTAVQFAEALFTFVTSFSSLLRSDDDFIGDVVKRPCSGGGLTAETAILYGSGTAGCASFYVKQQLEF